MSRRPTAGALTSDQLEDIAGLFKMLGEPMRLRILEAVCKEPRSVSEIVEMTEATQANVSKHLALMTTAGILRREKDGQRVYYKVKEPLVMRLCELVRTKWLE